MAAVESPSTSRGLRRARWRSTALRCGSLTRQEMTIGAPALGQLGSTSCAARTRPADAVKPTSAGSHRELKAMGHGPGAAHRRRQRRGWRRGRPGKWAIAAAGSSSPGAAAPRRRPRRDRGLWRWRAWRVANGGRRGQTTGGAGDRRSSAWAMGTGTDRRASRPGRSPLVRVATCARFRSAPGLSAARTLRTISSNPVWAFGGTTSPPSRSRGAGPAQPR